MTTMTDLETPEARDVRRLAEGLDIRTRAWIDGAYVDAASGETFARINPATGIEIARVAAGDAEDVDRAVRGARAAFESGVWAHAAPAKRKKVLVRLAR
ncbi:MAG: aldehyde dehydrogenase family protein, partial [Thermoleophilia bacterium]|nr:aldehyde dehydrogenase family protein [Thermoleophilia bacterium]